MAGLMYVILLFAVDPAAAGSATVDRDETLSTSSYIHRLLEQGIRREQILGIESLGVPRVCGTGMIDQQQSYRMTQTAGSSLPPDTRGWECIPGVIRNDGVESFIVEVNVNRSINQMTIDSISGKLVSPLELPIVLYDDGLGVDRISNDGVYTVGPFIYKISFPLPEFYNFDINSPDGLFSRP